MSLLRTASRLHPMLVAAAATHCPLHQVPGPGEKRLRANYPDTYEAEWRAWGFRKVSY